MGRLDELDHTDRLRGPRVRAPARIGPATAAPAPAAPRRAARQRASSVPVCSSCSKAPTRRGKGGAIRQLVQRLDPRHYRVSTFSRRRSTRSAITSSGASTASCPASAAWPCSTAAGTAVCSSSGSRDTRPPSSGAGRTTRSSSSNGRSFWRAMIIVKLWLQISDDEQLRRFDERQTDPLKRLEAHRRGLAQPLAQPRVRRRPPRRCSCVPITSWRRGTCCPASTRSSPACARFRRSTSGSRIGMKLWGTAVPTLDELDEVDSDPASD